MKVIVNQKNLKTALGLVEKIVSKNPSLPILNNILDEKIILHTKNNILYINSEKYKTQILGFDPKDFPIIHKIKNEPATIISSRILKNLLFSIVDSIALSETRPELAGVYTDFGSKKITFAATDSFRLSEIKFDSKNSDQHNVIIPRNTAIELIRIAGDIDGDLEIKIGDNQISFSNNEFELVSRLIDGNYPDYKKVIPTKFLSKILINKNDLEKDIRLAGLFSSHIADVKLICSDEAIILKSKNSDKGEIETVIPAVLKNDPFEISVNYHYLLDGLKIMDSDKVILEFTGNGNPLIIKPHDDKKELTYLIMPLRS